MFESRMNKENKNVGVVLMNGFKSLDYVIKELGLDQSKYNKKDNTLKSQDGTTYYFFDYRDYMIKFKMHGIQFREVIGR